MKLFNEKWANRYILRAKALTEKDKPTWKEKRNNKEFKQLERKYL